MHVISLLDLFAGTGGFAKGLSDAGFIIRKHYFSEIDKNAIANYKHNFPHATHLGCVSSVGDKLTERPNIVTFGSPCQGLSVAGKGLGFNDPRSKLFYQSADIIKKFKPDVFIWENVKGLLTRKHQEDFFAALQIFANVGGYRLEWQLVNTSWLLPQNRERIYLIGYLTEAGRNYSGIFPIRENTQLFRTSTFTRSNRVQTTICKTLTTGTLQGDNTYIDYRPHQQDRVYSSTGISPTLTTEAERTKITIPKSEMVLVKSATKTGHEMAFYGDTINYAFPTSSTRRGRVCKATAHTLDTVCSQAVLASRTDTQIRRLTEIECERLQGFPDNWTKWGIYEAKKSEIVKYPDKITYENGIAMIKKEVPKTQRYKMLGNAVTKDMVENIGRKLFL